MATYKYPHTMSSTQENNALWLHLQTKKVITNLQVANPNATIPTTPGDDSFQLLMPDNFGISLTHTWEPYDSISSRLAETIAKYYKAGKQITGIVKAGLGAESYSKTLNQFATNNLGEPVINVRADSPLIYKNSQPLQYNLSLTYVAHASGDSKILYDITKALMRASSPTRGTQGGQPANNIWIEPPLLFEVRAVAGSSIGGSVIPLFLQYAALIQVQPTYYGPYINGGPLKLDLILTFQDITPLFSNTFEAGTSVTTTSSGPPAPYNPTTP